MKKSGVLNSDLISRLAALSHTDLFVIADSGFPVASDVPIVDLRLVYGVPTFEQVVNAVLAEVAVEAAWLAMEMPETNVHNHSVAQRAEVPIEYLTHDQLKEFGRRAKFVVRSAEDTPYSNVVLRAGVGFPL